MSFTSRVSSCCSYFLLPRWDSCPSPSRMESLGLLVCQADVDCSSPVRAVTSIWSFASPSVSGVPPLHRRHLPWLCSHWYPCQSGSDLLLRACVRSHQRSGTKRWSGPLCCCSGALMHVVQRTWSSLRESDEPRRASICGHLCGRVLRTQLMGQHRSCVQDTTCHSLLLETMHKFQTQRQSCCCYSEWGRKLEQEESLCPYHNHWYLQASLSSLGHQCLRLQISDKVDNQYGRGTDLAHLAMLWTQNWHQK